MSGLKERSVTVDGEVVGLGEPEKGRRGVKKRRLIANGVQRGKRRSIC